MRTWWQHQGRNAADQLHWREVQLIHLYADTIAREAAVLAAQPVFGMTTELKPSLIVLGNRWYSSVPFAWRGVAEVVAPGLGRCCLGRSRRAVNRLRMGGRLDQMRAKGTIIGYSFIANRPIDVGVDYFFVISRYRAIYQSVPMLNGSSTKKLLSF